MFVCLFVCLYLCSVCSLDLVEEGQRLAQELKQKGVDCVIALTHMRWPNDIRLAENVAEIDLILGGHDHDFIVKNVNGKYIVKSGTDFRNFGKIVLTFDECGKFAVDVEKVDVVSSVEEDGYIKDVVSQYMGVGAICFQPDGSRMAILMYTEG